MNFPFHRERRTIDRVTPPSINGHTLESAYDSGTCRFVLECSCGAHFDTPFIDEALEIRELHELLAPLADQLDA